MKSYPSIPRKIVNSIPIIAFDKLDGSQIRVEWNKKSGFCKYGRRNGLLDDSYPVLTKAPDLIKEKYEKDLADIFKKNRCSHAVLFFEFFGNSSFAGQHNDSESHDVILFDVSLDKKGMVGPVDFIKTFGNLDIPKILYRGKANSSFEESVRNGSLADMTFEGVVCKGANPKRPKHVISFKIKNQAWIDKLKQICGDDESKFKQLI